MVSAGAIHTIKTLMSFAFIAAWSSTLHVYVLPMLGLTHDDHPAFFYGVAFEILTGAVLIVLAFDLMCTPPKELADEWAKQREERRRETIAYRKRWQRECDRDTLRSAVRKGTAPPELLLASDDDDEDEDE